LDSDKENAGSPVNKKCHISAITGSSAVASSTRKDIQGIPLAVSMHNKDPNREASRPTNVRRLSGDESLANEDVPSAKKDKGKSREIQNEFATPAATRTNDPKHGEDYSAYKGRGRYGKGAKNNQCVISSFL
jgi:hypothetical protein